MYTKRKVQAIRRILPKNFRQLIVKKCGENGRKTTVRAVSRVLRNESRDQWLVLDVSEAIAMLIEEEKNKRNKVKEVISSTPA